MKSFFYGSSRWLRFLVTSLQVGGSFVYRWPRQVQDPQVFPSSARSRLVLSLPLCMWSLFVRLCMLAGLYLQGWKILAIPRGQVKMAVYMNVTLVFVVVWNLAPVLLLFKSERLAEILRDLDHLAETLHVRSSPQQSLRSKVWVVAMPFLACTSLAYRFVGPDGGYTVPSLFTDFCMVVWFSQVLFVLHLFATLCRHLSHDLHHGTRAAVDRIATASCSPHEPPPTTEGSEPVTESAVTGSNGSKKKRKSLYEPLHQLEQHVWSVS